MKSQKLKIQNAQALIHNLRVSGCFLTILVKLNDHERSPTSGIWIWIWFFSNLLSFTLQEANYVPLLKLPRFLEGWSCQIREESKLILNIWYSVWVKRVTRVPGQFEMSSLLRHRSKLLKEQADDMISLHPGHQKQRKLKETISNPQDENSNLFCDTNRTPYVSCRKYVEDLSLPTLNMWMLWFKGFDNFLFFERWVAGRCWGKCGLCKRKLEWLGALVVGMICVLICRNRNRYQERWASVENWLGV